MKLVTAHKILIFATLMLCAAIVAWGIFQFNKDGETMGAVLAGAGALGGCAFGFYLRNFVKNLKS